MFWIMLVPGVSLSVSKQHYSKSYETDCNEILWRGMEELITTTDCTSDLDLFR